MPSVDEILASSPLSGLRRVSNGGGDWEESLWLDQASARGALAVPPRNGTDASTTAAMSSRFSPGLSVRSRRLPGVAA
jgi:hypothetical protein